MALNTFCGANVVVEIEGFPVLEAAGLQYNAVESKRPIYGYSSRLFDGVARGQVLIQGSLIINYVHQDYLFRVIELALGLESPPEVTVREEFEGQMESIYESDRIKTAILSDFGENADLAEGFKGHYWNVDPEFDVATNKSLETNFPNPFDGFGGLDIKVTFGRRNDFTGYTGDTGLILQDVYFTGRTNMIEISEDVIVEEYPFFGRNVTSIKQPYKIIEQPTQTETGQLTGDTEFVLK